MSGKTVSQSSSTSSSSSSAIDATYHLEQLNAILTMRLPQEISVLREHNQSIEQNYNELNEKYKQLSHRHSCAQKELEELRAFKAKTLNVLTRDNECQTDDDYDTNNCCDHSLNSKEKLRRKLFLCANDSTVSVPLIDNAILVNESSDESKCYNNDWISDDDIDEVPDSLNGSPNSCEHMESDLMVNTKKSLCDDLSDININGNNGGIAISDDFPDEIPDEIPDSLSNSPISCDINIKHEHNANEILKSSAESIIEISDNSDNDTKSNKTNDKLTKTKCKIKNNDNKSVKLVVKTLGPTVRKKDERKQLNGYSCKECEDYYKQRYNGVTEDEMKKKMKNCSRHRAKWSPYKSPEHFWNTDFPSTQECLRNGNMRYDDNCSPIGVKKKKKY